MSIRTIVLCLTTLTLSLGLVACEAFTGTGEETGDGGSVATWPSDITLVAIGDEVSDDLAVGAPMDLDWADQSSMACWPGTENMNFDGSHVVYALAGEMPDHAELVVTVTPEAGVDVSVWAYQIGTTSFATPPAIQSAVSCEAGYDAQDDANPGEPETLSLHTVNNPYNVVIGVAGASAIEEGAYTLSIEVIAD